MIEHSHNTYEITIFIFKECLGSKFDSFIVRSLFHFHIVCIVNHLIDVFFYSMDLFRTQKSIRIEIKSEIVFINERTSLFRSLENLSKFRMEQMRSRMSSHLCISLALFYDKFHQLSSNKVKN